MSGGVDSSAVAYIVKSLGNDCIGATMRLCTDTAQGCTTDTDVRDAKFVCDCLKIEHRVVDFSSDFEKYVYRLKETSNRSAPHAPDGHGRAIGGFCLYKRNAEGAWVPSAGNTKRKRAHGF